MKSRMLSVALVSGLLLPAPALAHVGDHQAVGLLQGLMHPLGGLDHLLAMVAVGLLAAREGGRALWALPAVFLAAMVLGGAFGMGGLMVPVVEPGIALSVILLGALLCLKQSGSTPATALLIALAGLVHGAAHGAELPAGASALLYGLGALGMTALLHGAGVGAVRALREGLAATAASRALRLSGLAIGVGGTMLVLPGV